LYTLLDLDNVELAEASTVLARLPLLSESIPASLNQDEQAALRKDTHPAAFTSFPCMPDLASRSGDKSSLRMCAGLLGFPRAATNGASYVIAARTLSLRSMEGERLVLFRKPLSLS
jgi:hypothetical protein